MNTTTTANRIHPLMAGAAISVTVLCLVGAASIAGILPNSRANVPATSAVPADVAAMTPASAAALAAPVAAPLAAPVVAQAAPALAPQKKPNPLQRRKPPPRKPPKRNSARRTRKIWKIGDGKMREDSLLRLPT